MFNHTGKCERFIVKVEMCVKNIKMQYIYCKPNSVTKIDNLRNTFKGNILEDINHG